MKKLISPTALLLAAFLLAACAMPALAQSWSGEDFTLEVPQGMLQLGPELAEDDPAWALAGVGDAAAKLQDYADMGVLANFISEDGKTNITVMQRQSDYSQRVYDLALLTPEELEQVLADLAESNNEDLTVTKDWFSVGDRPFYRVRLDMAGEEPMHEMLYGTIVNGYAVNIDIYGGDQEITPQQEQLMEELVSSIRFTRVTEKPQADPASLTGSLVLLGLLLLAVGVPLIYLPVKSRRDKKQKAKLAEQLSAYHRDHDPNEVQGEALFQNDTDCTKEAIHHFSFYQAYVKNIGELSFGAAMCLIMLCTAFLAHTEWWMKLLAAGVTVYYAYKIIAMPAAVEKIQRKVYGRGQSQTAHYTFYPEAFRVSGVQSASIIPYFQITTVRRRGQYVYLYYGPDNAYMVDQYGFTQGEFEDFTRFITEKTRKQ